MGDIIIMKECTYKSLIRKFIENCIFLFIFLFIFFPIISIFENNTSFIASIFGGFIINFVLEQFWTYTISVKEQLLKHHYQKEGKEFNKEYFDLYWHTSLIRIKILVYCNYISFVYTFIIRGSNDNNDLNKIILLYNQTSTFWDILGTIFLKILGFLEKSVSIITITVVLQIIVFWLLSRNKDNKKIDELIIKKKENFDQYTDDEKKILEE